MRRKNMVKDPEAILPVPEGREEGRYHFGEEHRPYVYFYIDKEQMSEQTYRPTTFTGMPPYFYVGKIYRDDGATDTEEENQSAGG